MRYNTLATACLLVLATPALTEEASVFDFRLGDHIIDYPLSELDVISAELNGFGGQSFIKVNAPNATEVVLTFREPRKTLQYLEHDWIDRTRFAPTSLGLREEEFIFGQTRVRDVQDALGQQGFHYECRHIQPIAGGLLTFVSFEIPERPDAVYTFVAEYSRDLADRGLVDIANVDLTKAIIVATIVSRPNYPEDFWCDGRIKYDADAAPPDQVILENERFADFLPPNVQSVETDPWEVTTEPYLMIRKNGAITWGDLLFILPNPDDCTQAELLAWAHTYEDKKLIDLKGQAVQGTFNLLLVGQKRVPLEAPIILDNALYAPIAGRSWPPFAIGSFVFGSFDFERIIAAEGDPSVFGFSLEFEKDAAGMEDNYWSLEGLFDAGNEAMRLCQEE